jgi:integrase
MARLRAAENAKDPATGRPLSPGVNFTGPGQYRARKLVDGVRVMKTFESDKLAREWREETEAKIREGSFVDRSSLDKMTLVTLVKRYKTDVMAIGGERRGAAEDLGHIPAIEKDAISGLKLSKLTPQAVRGFKDRQSALYAPATVVKRLGLLAAILTHARVAWGMPLQVNPASSQQVARPLGADVMRDRTLRPPSLAAIRAALASGQPAPKHEERILLDAVAETEYADDLPVVKLAIAQAMRQGEIIALQWEDIDFEAKIITIRGRHALGPKNSKAANRDVSKRKRKPKLSTLMASWEKRPMVAGAAAILLAHMGDQTHPKGLVFHVGTPNAFKVRIGRIIKEAGLVDLTFHDLRHEATTRLAKFYKNPAILKKITGHRGLKSLDRYFHPDLTEIAETYEFAGVSAH